MKALTFAMKFLAATVLLCVTGFCVFGFLASFEIGPISLWHCLYGACGIGTFAVAMRFLLQRTLGRTLGTLALFAGTVFCVLGFMESYHGFPWPLWVGYGALGCGCLAVGVALLRQRGGSSKPHGTDEHAELGCGAPTNLDQI
jgi:hypothetical protein